MLNQLLLLLVKYADFPFKHPFAVGIHVFPIRCIGNVFRLEHIKFSLPTRTWNAPLVAL